MIVNIYGEMHTKLCIFCGIVYIIENMHTMHQTDKTTHHDAHIYTDGGDLKRTQILFGLYNSINIILCLFSANALAQPKELFGKDCMHLCIDMCHMHAHSNIIFLYIYVWAM